MLVVLMLRNETITVKGHSISVTELPARFKFMHGIMIAKVVPALLRNLKDIMGSLGGLFKDEAFGKDVKIEDLSFDKLMSLDLNYELLMDIDLSSIGNALEEILNIQSGEEWFKFLEKFLEFTHVNNVCAGPGFDEVFAEDITLLIPVVLHTVKVNRFLGKGHTGADPKK